KVHAALSGRSFSISYLVLAVKHFFHFLSPAFSAGFHDSALSFSSSAATVPARRELLYDITSCSACQALFSLYFRLLQPKVVSRTCRELL
ncbi:hypothetical protein, partial [Lawsonibacter faecis]|uniref:hypothetical protein n=1 Tax=Lawsonibacter faecis TaxID=2763052 RepID=UPI001A9B68B0